MNKYLNIIIIGFFSILSVSIDFGFCLVLPILLIYNITNNRSLVLFVPISLISIYVFKNDLFLPSILMYVGVVLYDLVLSKKNSYYIDFIYLFLLNISLIMFIQNEIIIEILYINILYAFISSLIFIIIKYLIKINEGNFSYFEVLAVVVAILGSLSIEFVISIPFIIASFYAMYFSCNTSTVFSMIFSSCVSFTLLYLYDYEFALFLPFISAVFSLNNIIASFIVVIITAIVGAFYPVYFNYVLAVCLVCVFFELTKFSIIVPRISKKDTYEDIYKKSVSILNEDILAFSTFLDICCKESQKSKEYIHAMKDGVNSLKVNYCNRCYRREKCQRENTDITSDMRRLIIDVRNASFLIDDINSLSVCPFNIEMKKSALLISNRIISLDSQTKNKVVSQVFTNISTMLRQYTIDNNIKNEIDYNYLYKIKKSLADNGYNICYFEPLSIYNDNFVIMIGVRGFNFRDIKEDIERVVSNLSDQEVSVIFSHSEKSKVYFKIVPKRDIQVEYATTNIAFGITSGDCLLVDDTQDNRTVALICDGMGKGENAFDVSNEVVSLIEKLLKTSMSMHAIIQILNTYCQLKQSLETYSTLDFLEISKKDKKAKFYKLGSAPSYIYHKSKDIEKIENNKLPLGNEADIDNVSVSLDVGDIIIMSSDGVFENVVCEKDLENFISSITYLSVEKIVYQITNFLKTTTRITSDDISLIVLKIIAS